MINYTHRKLMMSPNHIMRCLKLVNNSTHRKQKFKRLLTDPQRLIDKIQYIFQTGDYCIKPYDVFKLQDKKERIIHAPRALDVLIQRIIYEAIYNDIDKYFIDNNFGCRREKGQSRALETAHKLYQNMALNKKFIKMDIRKYFYSIDRTILYNILKKYIEDDIILKLYMQYMIVPINTFASRHAKGLPLGNLLSQLAGLIYLNELDLFITNELKICDYIRYVDDFIIFNLDKHEARPIRNKIINFLDTKLNLKLSKCLITEKTQKTYVKFLGTRMYQNKISRSSYIIHKTKIVPEYSNFIASLEPALLLRGFPEFLSKGNFKKFIELL